VLARALAYNILKDPNWMALYPFACTERIAIELLPIPAELNNSEPVVRDLDLTWAWSSLGIWTAIGFGVLVARIRNVEVVG